MEVNFAFLISSASTGPVIRAVLEAVRRLGPPLFDGK